MCQCFTTFLSAILVETWSNNDADDSDDDDYDDDEGDDDGGDDDDEVSW